MQLIFNLYAPGQIQQPRLLWSSEASIGLDQGLQAALDFGSCYCCWVAFLLLLPVVVVVAAEEEAVAVAVRRIPAHKDWGLLVP